MKIVDAKGEFEERKKATHDKREYMPKVHKCPKAATKSIN